MTACPGCAEREARAARWQALATARKYLAEALEGLLAVYRTGNRARAEGALYRLEAARKVVAKCEEGVR